MSMKLNLSQGAYALLSLALRTTGEIEELPPLEKGGKNRNELAPRRINMEEASQKRHFHKLIDKWMVEQQEKEIELNKPFNDIINKISEKIINDNPKPKPVKGNEKLNKENTEKYLKKINSELRNNKDAVKAFEEINKNNSKEKEKLEIELNDKTWDFIKKCFIEFDEKRRFLEGDDSLLEELEKYFD